MLLSHTLDVHYAPTVRALGAPEQHVVRGDAVTLQCVAEGNPQPAISWTRQEGPMPSGQRVEKVKGDRISLYVEANIFIGNVVKNIYL